MCVKWYFVIRFSDGSRYSVVVRATDGGGRWKDTTVEITVINISKPPTFKQDEYVKTISENSKVGTSVIDIKAEYGDSTALLKYTFIKGNSDEMFCIDYLGVISVAQSLDREKVPSYELTVMVSLNDINDTTVVKVNLKDANDHAPSFEKSIVVLEVPENQGLLLVHALEFLYSSWEVRWPNGFCAGLRITRSGFEAWPGHCVVFLGKTLHSHGASLYPGL